MIEYVNKMTHNKAIFQVELKTDPVHPSWTFSPEKLTTATVKVLKEEGIDGRTELQAFDWRCLQIAQKEDPKIATAYLTEADMTTNMSSNDPKIAGLWTADYLLKNYQDSLPKMIAALGGKIWGPDTTEVSKASVAEAHRLGLRVVTWTADDPAVIEKMINDGVDGIITDRPDIARGLMAARRLALPQPVRFSRLLASQNS